MISKGRKIRRHPPPAKLLIRGDDFASPPYYGGGVYEATLGARERAELDGPPSKAVTEVPPYPNP